MTVLKSEISQLKSDKATLLTQLTAEKAAFNEKSENIVKLTSELKQLTAEHKECQSVFALKNEIIAQKDQKLVELAKENDQSKKALHELRAQIDKLLTANESTSAESATQGE